MLSANNNFSIAAPELSFACAAKRELLDDEIRRREQSLREATLRPYYVEDSPSICEDESTRTVRSLGFDDWDGEWRLVLREAIHESPSSEPEESIQPLVDCSFDEKMYLLEKLWPRLVDHINQWLRADAKRLSSELGDSPWGDA